MTRVSGDDVRDGHVWNGFDYALQVWVVEGVVPPGNGPSFTKMLDLNMLVIPGGKERTEAEYRELFAQSGFRLTRGSHRVTARVERLMPEVGVEPTRPEGHGILSPARLPVPPLRPDGDGTRGSDGRCRPARNCDPAAPGGNRRSRAGHRLGWPPCASGCSRGAATAPA